MNNATNGAGRMTKREFDKLTKENWGERMASDERCSYRDSRFLEHAGSPSRNPTAKPFDYIAFRAAEAAREGVLPLALGSKFRAPQAFRAANGRPMLEGRSFGAWNVRDGARKAR